MDIFEIDNQCVIFLKNKLKLIMNRNISPIIQVSELLKLYELEDLIIVDVSNGINAKSNYESKHLKGAIHVDLDTQLAEINRDLSIGGRHPLPKIENFALTLSNLGISAHRHVVIYDDKNASNAAARFWWMLKSVGHEKVQILNGGFQEAEKYNLPLSSKKESITKTELYKVDHWKLKIAEMDEIENHSQSEHHLLIDVRDPKRYTGESEPIDLIAGHIPGAINIPFTENLDENGLFLSPDVLKKKYESVLGDINTENITFHCGSGVTACHSLLAVAYAGLKIPKLYVGSWSEWSRNNKAIETNI